MEQSQSQKQPRIVSSIQIHMRPFSDLTNRHQATQSKKLSLSTVAVVSNSSTRSTQNPNRLSPRTPTPARNRKNTMLKTRSKNKVVAAVPAYSIHPKKTENNTKKSKSIMEEDVCALPNNKRRKCSSTGSAGKYVAPQDFIDRQRAYYKEIDEYELEVEEVESSSEEEE